MVRVAALLLSAALLLGCGGSSVPCAGVEVGGMCWIGHDGITVTPERAARIYQIARRHWGEDRDPAGWTVEFGIQPVVHVDQDVAGAAVRHAVDGVSYFGWACPQHRLIVIQPFDGSDCIERSVIFHELGHAWGVPEGDPRLYGEYVLMREAMEGSGWPGCTSADGDGDEDDR